MKMSDLITEEEFNKIKEQLDDTTINNIGLIGTTIFNKLFKSGLIDNNDKLCAVTTMVFEELLGDFKCIKDLDNHIELTNRNLSLDFLNKIEKTLLIISRMSTYSMILTIIKEMANNDDTSLSNDKVLH